MWYLIVSIPELCNLTYFDFFGIGLCFELVPDLLVMVFLFVFRSWFVGYDLVQCS